MMAIDTPVELNFVQLPFFWCARRGAPKEKGPREAWSFWARIEDSSELRK